MRSVAIHRSMGKISKKIYSFAPYIIDLAKKMLFNVLRLDCAKRCCIEILLSEAVLEALPAKITLATNGSL